MIGAVPKASVGTVEILPSILLVLRIRSCVIVDSFRFFSVTDPQLGTTGGIGAVPNALVVAKILLLRIVARYRTSDC
jgi:hypothetical protein